MEPDLPEVHRDRTRGNCVGTWQLLTQEKRFIPKEWSKEGGCREAVRSQCLVTLQIRQSCEWKCLGGGGRAGDLQLALPTYVFLCFCEMS